MYINFSKNLPLGINIILSALGAKMNGANYEDE